LTPRQVRKVFEIKSDVPPDCDTTTFSSYEWLTPAEILKRSAAGGNMKSDIPKLITLCYLP